MMRQILIGLSVVFWAPSALASPDLSREWTQKAASLYQAIEDVSDRLSRELSPMETLPSDVKADLHRFGLTATQLAKSANQNGLPEDLQCIFRGMAEETGAQIIAFDQAETLSARQDALERLSSMLKDASTIGKAAQLAFEHAGPPDYQNLEETAPACGADLKSAYEYFTEQP